MAFEATQDCAGRSTNYAIGVCACGSDEVSSMEVCGNCLSFFPLPLYTRDPADSPPPLLPGFGSDSQTDATGASCLFPSPRNPC